MPDTPKTSVPLLERIRETYREDLVTVREKAVSLFILNALLAVGFLGLGLLYRSSPTPPGRLS